MFADAPMQYPFAERSAEPRCPVTVASGRFSKSR
jgi:hypothetical protein